MKTCPDVLMAIAVIAAMLYYFHQNIRFLLQGLLYRSLRAEQRAALAYQNELWHEYHGRRFPTSQLVVAIIVGALIFGALVCWDMGLFK